MSLVSAGFWGGSGSRVMPHQTPIRLFWRCCCGRKCSTGQALRYHAKNEPALASAVKESNVTKSFFWKRRGRRAAGSQEADTLPENRLSGIPRGCARLRARLRAGSAHTPFTVQSARNEQPRTNRAPADANFFHGSPHRCRRFVPRSVLPPVGVKFVWHWPILGGEGQ